MFARISWTDSTSASLVSFSYYTPFARSFCCQNIVIHFSALLVSLTLANYLACFVQSVLLMKLYNSFLLKFFKSFFCLLFMLILQNFVYQLSSGLFVEHIFPICIFSSFLIQCFIFIYLNSFRKHFALPKCVRCC